MLPWASLVAQTVKNLPAIQKTWNQSLDNPPEKGMATHSSVLVWRIPWTEEPGGLHSMESKESDTPKRLTFTLWLSQTSLPVYLPSWGWGDLWKSGLPLLSDRTFPSPAHVLQPAYWDPIRFLVSLLLPSFTLIPFPLYWEWISPLLQPLFMTSSFPHQNRCSWRHLI